MRIIVRLHLKDHQAVFDMDIPAATSGTIDAVGGAHHLVITPAVPVSVLPETIILKFDAVSIREGFLMTDQKFQTIQQMAHDILLK